MIYIRILRSIAVVRSDGNRVTLVTVPDVRGHSVNNSLYVRTWSLASTRALEPITKSGKRAQTSGRVGDLAKLSATVGRPEQGMQFWESSFTARGSSFPHSSLPPCLFSSLSLLSSRSRTPYWKARW